MHALVRFAQIPPANTFSTGEIYPHVIAALGCTAEQYRLASLRYDLSKLRAKGLVEKLPRCRRYRLPAEGYSVCLIFLKLFHRVYAPLTAALLHPIPADQVLPDPKRSLLDRLYQHLTDALDHLLRAVGLAFSPPLNLTQLVSRMPSNFIFRIAMQLLVSSFSILRIVKSLMLKGWKRILNLSGRLLC